MRIKPFHYSYPDFKKIKDVQTFFEGVKNIYPELKKKGVYLQGKKDAIFLYRIKTKFRVHHGLLVGLSIEDYMNGVIRKHENTLIEQEENISKLMRERSAVIKPVLVAYQERKKIKDIMASCFLGKRPKFVVKFEKEQQIHEFYLITEVKWIKLLQKEFKDKVGKAYIADGHHRMASISQLITKNPNLAKEGLNSILCALFDFNELSILPYNRIIHFDKKLDEPEFIKVISPYASIQLIDRVVAPSKKSHMLMYLNKVAYEIIWKKDLIKKYKAKFRICFDIDLFNDIILTAIFKIDDIRLSKRISYIEGNRSSKSICNQIDGMENAVAFIFFPVKALEFTKVADQHMVLPPKSTWFEPRIRNGIIVQDIPI